MNSGAITTSHSIALPISAARFGQALTDPAFLNYFSVILPMGIFNVVGFTAEHRERRGGRRSLSARSHP